MDIKHSPVLTFLLQVALVIFGVLLCCLGLTCCKYTRVVNKYEAIKTQSEDSKVIRRDTRID